MQERINFFVGLDTHKDSISIAACEAGREPARFVGTIGADVQGLFKTLAKAGDPARVSVVYEAGRWASGCTGSCAGEAIAARSLLRR